ncbi:MAG TPA: HWE histidine kinase domain-containing protein [Sphingomonadaceae bacterium]
MGRVPAFRSIILADVRPLKAAGWTALAVAGVTALRWGVDGGAAGLPFATYFPAIVLVALFLGWRYGAAAALASGVIANRLFKAQPVLFYASWRNTLFVAFYVLICAILIYIAEMLRRLIREQERASRREALLNAELVHRVKNMLATINSIASMSARHADPEEFVDAFSGRIAALGRATDLLGSGHEVACELTQLIETVIAPFRDEANFAVVGPKCDILRDSCIPLALALHELCTNAAKYGALSTPEGRVALAWDVRETPERQVLIAWRESNGPPVGPVSRHGMGMALLRPQPGLAEVRLEFPPEGATCEIVLVRPPEPKT